MSATFAFAVGIRNTMEPDWYSTAFTRPLS